ncbi:MAG: mycofactocin biosynthesis glycosyltransferase MftF [Aeromicrobium sp.]
MTTAAPRLPDGFGVHLHDDVQVGRFLVSRSRVVRLSDEARDLLSDRELRVTSSRTAQLASRLLDLDLGDPVLDGVPGPGLDLLTVVIPVRDCADGVDRLLRRLGTRVRCVVVDDASHDSRALAGVVEGHGAALLRLDMNIGPAGARDRGLREARTPYVAFVDADIDVLPEVLERLLHHLVDPGLAAVAPRVLSAEVGSWLGRYERSFGSIDLGPRAATVRQWSPVSYVPTACLVTRVAALGEGFDTTMRVGEDVDLVWRLDRDGHRVRYAAEVTVTHDIRESFPDWLGRKTFYGQSAALLARRHGARMAPGVMSPIAATAVAGLLVQRRWSTAVSLACVAVTARSAWNGTPSDLPRRQRAAVLQATLRGMIGQTSGLMLRHWAPVTLALSICSTRMRRAAAVVGLADGLLAHHTSKVTLDPIRFIAMRRAEHLAYGIGVWSGAARERSADCLRLHWLPIKLRKSTP